MGENKVKRIINLFILAFSLLIISCDSFTPKAPVEYDDGTWAGIFKGYWHGMNENYVFWDLDSPNGEWDDIYDEYLPRFESLGTVYPVSDNPTAAEIDTKKANNEKAIKLFIELTQNLSDGHYVMYVSNLNNPGADAYISPGVLRIMKESKPEISDEELINAFYSIYSMEKFDLETNYFFPEYYSETYQNILYYTFGLPLSDTGDIHAANTDALVAKLNSYIGESEGVKYTSIEETLLTEKYFKEWVFYKSSNTNNAISVLIGLTKENQEDKIPENCIYIGFDSFSFYPFLQDGSMLALLQYFHELKINPDTSGIIFDIRGNGGGYNVDRELLFSDIVADRFVFGFNRMKTGDNRLSYGPWLELAIPRYALGDDADGYTKPALFNKPIVALTNINSVSNAEIAPIFIKQLPKGVSIGGRTFGGTGFLMNDNTGVNAGSFSVGSIINLVYTPGTEVVDKSFRSYEGIGVEPTIDVPFNLENFTAGKDDRLLRAFEYVKYGR